MSEKLSDYRDKRDFESTPEPDAVEQNSGPGRSYVFHKHAATRLHYDLRLEHDGVLLSWAVPKGPSLDTRERRLAIRVEDHPVSYGSFEGVIPEGEYGGGTVMSWDEGTWSPHGDVDRSLGDGKLVFDLLGEKLRGRFALIHTGARKTGRDRNQWLLIKEKDEAVRPSDEYDIARELPDSASTGRTMEEIAESGDVVGDDEEEDEEDGPTDPSAIVGAVRAPVPTDPRPQLAQPAARPPTGDGWLHEIKYDGYRVLLVRSKDGVRALTREGHDWSDRFAPLVEAAHGLPADSFVIDCEAVVLDRSGVPDFAALQESLACGRPRPLAAFCFDLPYLQGFDLSRAELAERKNALSRLLADAEGSTLRYAEHLPDAPSDLLPRACELGAEGIVSKRADAPYRPGRSRAWRKSKCVRRQEFVVVGYVPSSSAIGGLGALLLGYYTADGEVAFAGRAGSGITERQGRRLLDELSGLRRDHPEMLGDAPHSETIVWVEPSLVVEVAFSEWTPKGRLRHASLVGVRRDVDAGSVVRDPDPMSPDAGPDADRSGGARENPEGDATVAGVRITHPDRVMIPGGPTKRDLAGYYAAVSDHVLRHLADRPLTLLRCTQGTDGECFWQRHVDDGVVRGVRAFTALEREYVTVDDVTGLVGLVQYLTVEFHVWGSTTARPDMPDRIVFDLDPGPGTDWDDVRAAALLARKILESHGLESFVKTSGGKGLHVTVPIAPRVPVTDAAAATKVLARRMVDAAPDSLTIDPRKSARADRIFIDWHRNGAGQSTVAPYVVRARKGAPVSTPVTWDELVSGLDPAAYTIDQVKDRLASTADPWANIGDVDQHLPQESFDV
jgi:bifunctional non-homologous end joining protein LigD